MTNATQTISQNRQRAKYFLLTHLIGSTPPVMALSVPQTSINKTLPLSCLN
jgi:hypothetical protein